MTNFTNIFMSISYNIDSKFAEAKELENSCKNISILEQLVYFFSNFFNIPQTNLLNNNRDTNLNYKKANKLQFLYQMMFYI